MGFNRGDQVEVVSKQEGFKGSHYPAVVINSEHVKKKYTVQYKTLLNDDESGPLTETVDADEVRPEPPEIEMNVLKMYDKVDAFDNDGWWVGKITGKNGEMYFVYFDKTKDEASYPFNRLRIHQDWVDGKWVSSSSSKRLLV